MAMTEEELEDRLSLPTDGVRAALASLDGDVLVLGAGGKMGPTLARMARRALPAGREVLAVSRFSSAAARAGLERHGVRAIPCDLLDPAAIARLPDAANVIFMAGHKFGTSDAPGLTWMSNAVLPAHVAARYPKSRIVVFSTGCVYGLTTPSSGGAREEDPLAPPGEYAHSCIARERVFDHHSRVHGTPTLMFRLNYAIDLRYGVLHDIATQVWRDEPFDVTTGHVNVIWQGDANARAIQSLAHVASPPAVLNVTGRECVSTRWLAERFAAIFGKPPRITGTEAPTVWLSNAAKSIAWFGEPTVSLDEMIQMTADWVRAGGGSLGKPTHFEARDGKF
jgi:nucleoside-diphosphate-sugar epimerase